MRETTWLQPLNVRTFFSTPVSLANLGTIKLGMKLHSCRSRFSLDGAGTLLVLFFIPAVWQGQPNRSSFFFNFLWDGCESISLGEVTFSVRPQPPLLHLIWSF